MPNRREFLGWAGAGALLAVGGTPLHASGPAPAPGAAAEPWDVSWAERLTAPHRAVFDSPEVSQGLGVVRPFFWRDQYHEVYGTPPEQMNAVLVIRHEAIPLAMDDQFWARHQLGKVTQLKDGTSGAWRTSNPVWTAPAELPAQFASYGLKNFLGQGGVVLACNLALQHMAAELAQGSGATPDAVTAEARQHLLPGVILQPSGIFALARAQEAGCHYVLAS
jgi:hypothetical protein